MSSSVELGFLEKCEPWQVESRLFPSKVGGKPAWLDLDDLPSPERLQCKRCSKQMIFLCQVYAPIEIEESHASSFDNFHRTLFVFICKNADCGQRNNSENIKVFRSSLPRKNKYYDIEPPIGQPDTNFSLRKWVKLCNLCGCLSEKQCSKCKKVHYCSREHQVLDWKEGHKNECNGIVQDHTSKFLFEEFELVTEPEELNEKITNEEEELLKFNKLQEEGKTGTLANVSETELESHAVEHKDKTFSKFKKRISLDPDQVLRYQKGGEPLWIAKNPIPETIPNCEYCHSQRQFEFQIMPQVLSLLNDTCLDFGVIAVYTCKSSCIADIMYREEFVFKQDVEINDL